MASFPCESHNPFKFFVAPQEYIANNLICGATNLKENGLLIDLTWSQLVYRDINKLTIVGRYINDTFNSITVKSVLIRTNRCRKWFLLKFTLGVN